MSQTTRRRFARTLAVAGAALPLAGQTPSPAMETPSLASALTTVVRAQSGRYLSAADLAQVARDFQQYARLLEQVRAFELQNPDAPRF